MGKRLNRTVRNWRWWVALPVVPFAIVAEVIEMLAWGLLHLSDFIELPFLAIFRWVKEGAKP